MEEEIYMKQSNEDIGNIMEEGLQQHTTSVEFESVWNKVPKNKGRIYRLRKVMAIPLIAAICLFMVGFASYKVFRNIDKTDYPFIDDSRVKGKWESVDFVKKIENFNPGKESWKSDLYLSSLVFIKNGEMLMSANNGNLAYTTLTWTKDMILDKQEKTASKYQVKDINGTIYMFFEWKSGDYMFRNETPGFYVLKNVDNDDYSNYKVKSVKQDKIDYPFIDDAEMKGKWESVDFVQAIDNFKPGQKSWFDSLHLTGLNINENGKLDFMIESKLASPSFRTWTKGMIILNTDEEKTASKCEIRYINGAAYMFFQWKNGDYIYRGATPRYYVLKKVQ
jgi:bla regulator protein blaR1